MTFDESLDSRYCNYIAYWEQLLERDYNNHLQQKGAHRHDHLADDDNLFWTVWWYRHSQFTVKAHTEVGFRNQQLKKIAGNWHCKQKHKSWLLPDQATRYYTNCLHKHCNAVKHVFIHHIWLFSNIVSNIDDHLTDSQIYGVNPVKLINWLF